MNIKKIKKLLNNIVKDNKAKKIFASALIAGGLITSMQANEVSVFAGLENPNIKKKIEKPIEVKYQSKKLQQLNYDNFVIDMEQKEKKDRIIKDNYNYIIENINNMGTKKVQDKITNALKELKKHNYPHIEDLVELIKSKKGNINQLQELSIGTFLKNDDTISIYRVATQIKEYEKNSNVSKSIRDNIKKIGTVNDIVKYLQSTNKKLDFNSINKDTVVKIDLTNSSVEKFKNPPKKQTIVKKSVDKEAVDNVVKEMFSQIDTKEIEYQKTINQLKEIKEKREVKTNIKTKVKIEKKQTKKQTDFYTEKQIIELNKELAKNTLIEKFGNEKGKGLYSIVEKMASQLYEHDELKSSFALNSILQTISIESNFNPNAKNISKLDHSHGLTQVNIQTKSYRGDVLRVLRINKDKAGVGILYNFWKKNKNNLNTLSEILKDPKINIMIGMMIMENKSSYRNIKKLNESRQSALENKVERVISKYSKKKNNMEDLKKYIEKLDKTAKKEFFSTLNAQTAYNGLDMLRNTPYLTKILKEKNKMLKNNEKLLIARVENKKSSYQIKKG